MSGDELTLIIITALIAGAISSVGSSLLTIAGLRVQIGYIEKNIEKIEKANTRAHERIDDLQEEMRSN